MSLVDKQFGSKMDKIYCGPCYDAQFATRCDGCGEIFRAGKVGNFNFLTISYLTYFTLLFQKKYTMCYFLLNYYLSYNIRMKKNLLMFQFKNNYIKNKQDRVINTRVNRIWLTLSMKHDSKINIYHQMYI